MTLGGIRLSPQQRRLWTFLQEAAPVSTAGCMLSIRRALDRDALVSACEKLVDRHEILRTSFRRFEGFTVPLQVVEEKGSVAFEEIDLSGRSLEEMERLLLEPVSHPSVLSVVLGPDRRALVLRVPALCTDAAGLRILARDLLRLYEGGDLEEVAQYADLSEWMNELLQVEEAEEGRSYWRSLDLAELIERSLPEARPSGAPFAPGVVRAEASVDPSILSARAEEIGATPEDLLLAGWLALICLRTGQPEALSGVHLDGRDYAELEDAAGRFARVVPVRAGLSGGLGFRRFVQEVAGSLALARTWQECFDWDLLHKERARTFFPFSFEMVEERGAIDQVWACGERFEVRLTASWRDEGLSLALWYDRSRLSIAAAHLLLERFRAVLDQVLRNVDTELGSLAGFDIAETHRLVVELNDTAVAADQVGVVRQFERWASENPGAPAVTFGGRSLTYGEIDERSDRLAACFEAMGARPGEVIPICLERSPEMVIALLAVLKAGCAYAPLDPSQPADRLASMLSDLSPRLVASEERRLGVLPEGLRAVCLDRDRSEVDRHRWIRRSSPPAEQLAYVIFTSGSTGRPKGVGVEHRQLASYVHAVRQRLDLPAGSRFGMVSTFAADLGHTVLFPALTSGGCLDILPLEQVSDPAAWVEHFRRRPVDCLKIVPGHLRALLSASGSSDILPRRLLVLGGESLPWELIEQIREIAPECSILNHYGPTETTVGVLTHPVRDGRSAGGTVPVGRPLANTTAHVLGRDLILVPPGAVGEILIGGRQVSRGYLGHPDVTASRFLPDPFTDEPGARLYRTGDLGRRLPDGSIEFLGRADHQVKIRGFRVEPGEIEATLRTYAPVRQALVVPHQQNGSGPRLVAYLTVNGVKPTLRELRDHAARSLPDYMVPSAFVLLDSFPLTSNGKIDRQALPDPEAAGFRLAGERVAPRNRTERILASIWCEILGLAEIGVHDNFFDLGGDSILVIRVASKAHQAGVRLVPRQLFDHQTIAALAEVAGALPELEAEQEVITGPVPLTPIQCLFFEQELAEPHHWNQSMMLELRRPADAARLDAVVRRLVEHHDALRLRFLRDGSDWHQYNPAPDGTSPFTWVDLAALPDEMWRPALEHAADQVQRSLDLSAGPLLRVVLLNRGSRGSSRLLLVVHHLAIDGVSWAVLLEDLAKGYEQLSAGQPIERPAKTTSFRRWARWLRDRASSEEAKAQLAHWLRVPHGGRLLLATEPPPEGDFLATGDLMALLETEETRALIQEAPQAYHTQMDDLLLTALARALRSLLGGGLLLVDLEGHGREPVTDIDLSRTVGWFTTIFPAWLGPVAGADPALDIKQVKEQLRSIPNRGLDFGVLRHLSDDAVVRERLRALPAAELRFNYLGRLDGAASGTTQFSPATEGRGVERSPQAPVRYLLDLVAWVSGGRLQVSWIYDARRLHRQVVEELARRHVQELRAIVEHCRSVKTASYTPSDFPEAGLTQDALDNLMEQLGEAGDL